MKSKVMLVALLLLPLSAVGCLERTAHRDQKEQAAHDAGSVPDTIKSEAEPADDRSIILSQVIEHHATSQKARNEAIRSAAGDVEKITAAHEAFSQHDFPQQIYDFALAKDDDASLDACRYLIRKFYLSKLRYAAINHVVEHHFNKPGIDEFFMSLVHGYASDPVADLCLEAAMKAPSQKTRAHATYQLALLQLQRRDWCLDSGEARQNYVDSLGQEAVDYLLSDEGVDEIASLLTQVIAEYPDVQYFDYSISKRAQQSLFTLRNLEVGCPIPPVVGKNSAGRKITLHDHQGKIVVVCFWAHWCSVCMESLPRENEFVASMRDRPFVWLGVNGDDDVELLRKAESSGTVNFQSFHDGREGAIATQWNVWGFPTLFVVDHEGIIRYRSRGHVDLDLVFPLVEELVVEQEAEIAKR